MLLCIEASHRNTAFAVLDRLAEAAPSATARLVADNDFVNGAVILATCNRFEAYLEVDEPTTAGAALAVQATIDAMTAAGASDADAMRASIATHTGDAVAGHLFAVTSGLESVVVGEEEIAGQVRRALDRARADGTVTGQLERLFQRAAQTSRDVRGATDLARAGRSLARLALELVSSRVTDWAAARVLLVGTGRYAATTITALQQRGAGDIAVYSATGRAQQFAHKYGVRAEADLREAIAEAEIVITCTSRYTITAEDVTNANRRIVIDLGLPRNVEAAVGDLPGVELMDLEIIALHAPVAGFANASDAHSLVGSAVAEYTAHREAAPAIVALRKHVFDALDAEVARSASRSGDERTAEALRHLVGVILHTPSVRARDLAREGRIEEFEAGIEAVFGVVPDAPAAQLRTADPGAQDAQTA